MPLRVTGHVIGLQAFWKDGEGAPTAVPVPAWGLRLLAALGGLGLIAPPPRDLRPRAAR